MVIDVSHYIDDWERILRSSPATGRSYSHAYILAALEQWEKDPMLVPSCRYRARHLLYEFGGMTRPRPARSPISRKMNATPRTGWRGVGEWVR